MSASALNPADVSTTPKEAKTRERRPLWDAAAMAALGGCAVASWGPTFGGWSGYLAAGGGLLLGLAVGLVSAWRKWSVAFTAAIVLIVYLVFVGPLALRDSVIAGFVPSLDTLQRGSLLFVQAWRDLLTLGLPAGAFSGPAVVPMLAALICSTLGVRLAVRPSKYLWALLPMLVNLAVSILWGSRVAPLALWVGAAFALIAVAWASWRQRRDLVAQSIAMDPKLAAHGRRRGRLPLAAGLLVGAVAVSAAAAPAVAGLNDRFVLRDVVHPPFDPRAYASPLMSYRDLEVAQEGSVQFTATGLQQGDRVRTAVLDSYDGIVYRVGESSAGFSRIGGTVDAQPGQENAPLRTVQYRVDNYASLWVPGGGELRTIDFTSAAAAVKRTLYYNSDTGTVATTAGLSTGNTYNVTSVSLHKYSDDQLRSYGLAAITLPDAQLVPDSVGKTAAEYTDGAETGFDQLKALEKHLQQGAYSNGKDGKSSSGHSAYRINLMLTSPQLVGDDEQYAVAMALMARQLGLPVRVVMGFYPDGGTYPTGAWKATGKQAHVWVEALFNQAGWVSFDPTPDRSHVPKTTVKKPPPKPKPRVQPPPIPPKEPVQPPTDLAGDKTNKSDTSKHGSLVRYLVWTAQGLGGALVLTSPVLLIAALRRRRSTRRRTAPVPADAVAGGWAEVVDAAADLGIRVDHRLTRREAAAVIAQAAPSAAPTALADRIDAGVFGPNQPDQGAVGETWTLVKTTIASLRQQASRKRRLLWWVTAKSLRHPSPVAPPTDTATKSWFHRFGRKQ